LVRAGIAATDFVCAPVADAPYGDATPRKVSAQVTELFARRRLYAPATAMD